MDFQFSSQVPPGTYRDDGLAGGIALRVHNDTDKEVSGTRRAQSDWASHVCPVGLYHGGLGERFSFLSVTVPECIPGRLELISYGNEYAFLYDDEMEKLDLRNFRKGRDNMLSVFEKDAFNDAITSGTRPEKLLQAQLFKEMMAIDRPRATTTMKAWAKFVQLASRTRSRPFETLDEYLPSRVIDAGELLWYGTLTFAMGLTIPVEHIDTCFRLARPGYEAISLVNDIYSWPKEKRDAELAGQDHVFNAVWVIMGEKACDEGTAISLCKDKIRLEIDKFQDNVELAKAGKMPRDVILYLEAVKLSHVGNLVWSIYCPRYRV